MKKTAVLLLLLVVTITSFSQNETVVATEKNVLKVNTLALLIGSGSVFYERKVTDLVSAQLGAGYLNYKIGESKFSGLILTPECKFYIRNNAIDGFYISPYLRYNQYKYDQNENSGKGSYTSMGGGVAFGRQWIFSKGFVMDLFFGGHYTDGKVDITSGEDPADVTKFEGFKTRVGFAIGFAF
jgi:hypothetical protein